VKKENGDEGENALFSEDDYDHEINRDTLLDSDNRDINNNNKMRHSSKSEYYGAGNTLDDS
jgi:hypothetical protein